MAGPNPVSAFPSYSTVGNILGTELLYLGVAGVAPYKLTTLQLQTLYPASTALTGTETLVTTSGSTVSKTTTSQMITQASASGTLIGTELFLNSPAAGSVQKSTLANLVRAPAASTSIAGTELILQSPATGSVKNTTLAQIVTQATAAGNPAAGDLFYTTQSSNLRAYALSQIGAFSNVYTGAGTANAQTVTLSPVPTAYYTGMVVTFFPGNANTGATTLNVNGLGTKNIFAYGAALLGGELQTSSLAELVYDGTQFQLLNPKDSTGSFTATLTNMASGGTGTINWRIVNGKTVFWTIPNSITGTATATTTMSLTGIPAALQPATAKEILFRFEDNGAINNTQLGCMAATSSSSWLLSTNFGTGGNNWTSATVRGIMASSPTISYTLD